MKQAAAGQKRFDWALLLVPLIGLTAVWPLLTQPFPSTDDGMLHTLRLVQFDRCLQHGALCLRWAPDMAHGYGYPVFNFAFNVSIFAAEGWHLLGAGFTQSVALAFASAVLIAGWGAYLLGRDLGGWPAGLAAATAYMYAPYQFFDSMYRGNLAESWALAWLPWLLWTARRAVVRRCWRDIVPFALVYAAQIYTHNIYTMLGSPVIGLYLVLLWWKEGHDRRDLWRLAAMVTLGIALGAFFWLPALAEQGWTHYAPGLFDYTVHFLRLDELLSWPPQVDLALLNFYPPRSLNWGMLILIVLGIVLYVVRSRNRAGRNGEWAFFLGVFVLASWMTLDLSAAVWRVIRPLQIVQMPWRFLGLASLAGSVCAGMAVSRLLSYVKGRPRERAASLAVVAAALFLPAAASFAWTYAAPFSRSAGMGVSDILRWEYGTGLIGTTSMNEFLPIWAQMPEEPAHPALLTEDDPVVPRLDESTLPEGAQVLAARYEIMRADLVIDTPQPFRARYNQFYFPDWQVTVDGRRVSPIVTQPYGLLGFDVPAGRHEIAVRPTWTPARLAGDLISGLALLAAAVLWGLDRCRARRAGMPTIPGRGAAVIALAALALLGFKEGLIDHTENLFRAHRFNGEAVSGVQYEASLNLGNTLTLYGYDLPARATPSGEPLRVDLYVGARRAVEGDYMAYARLVDEEGRLWSLPDNGTPAEFRLPPSTRLWPTDAYAHWAYLAYVLPGTPPGEYWIEVAFFERGTWRGLNVLDVGGQFVSQKARLGPVQIARPRTPPAVEDLDVEYPLPEAVRSGVRCLGSTLDPESAYPGDAVDLVLFWQAAHGPAAQKPAVDYGVTLALVSDVDHLVVAENLALGRRTHPTSNWLAGEVVRSPHRVRVPAGAKEGAYTWQATIVDAQGEAVGLPVSLVGMAIKPLSRAVVPLSQMQHVIEADLDRRVRLLGYDLDLPSGAVPAADAELMAGDALSLTLYWQAAQEMATSYKVFVQLVGPDGVLAQVDALPANGARPTTGWVTWEVVADRYTLAIPDAAAPGSYRLIAGMYHPKTLQRLNVLDPDGNAAGDYVTLQEVVLR